MKIVFQFGEFLGEDNSFWGDLLIAVLGAFVGTGGALLLYYRQIKDQKKKEVDTLYNMQKDQLDYLYHVIANAIKMTDLMIIELARFSEFVKNSPTKKTILILTVNSDLNRIVNRINQDSYFLAYKTLIKDDRIGKIFTIVDYLFEVLEDIKDYYIKINKIKDDNRERFLNSMQDLIQMIINERTNQRKREGTSGENYLFFDFHLKKYQEFFEPDIDDLQIFDEKFASPLLQNIKIKNASVQYQEFYKELNEVAERLSISLRRMELKNKNEANSLGEYGISLSTSIEKLKGLTIPLENFVDKQPKRSEIHAIS